MHDEHSFVHILHDTFLHVTCVYRPWLVALAIHLLYIHHAWLTRLQMKELYICDVIKQNESEVGQIEFSDWLYT